MFHHSLFPCSCELNLLCDWDQVFADIVASQSSFWGHLTAPGAQLFFHHKSQIKLRRRGGYPQEQNIAVVRAIATLERKSLVGSENDARFDTRLHLDSHPSYQASELSAEDDPEMDEREKSRREKISKANKGNVPWNKGRKHSPETLQKIRERTKLAMQNPKVKMKLVNIGHVQSDETRMKIGAGVREGWQRRREMLLVQESCFFEWQNIIAEASRKGYGSDEELHWDSYKTLDEQLKKEWMESIESRKATPRLKGSKRAPKSAEQRRKISEAISAKWADPDYRGRVCSGLAKYHGIPVGAERRPRRKPAGDGRLAEPKVAAKKRVTEPKDAEKEAKSAKTLIQKKKKSNAPSYRDPMARSKLEMIRKIREQRATMEEKKRDATERARLLIAEAEKAAKALEAAALKSPLARASLLETRKLIAEATQALERVGPGQTPPLENAPIDAGQQVNGTPSASLFSIQWDDNDDGGNGVGFVLSDEISSTGGEPSPEIQGSETGTMNPEVSASHRGSPSPDGLDDESSPRPGDERSSPERTGDSFQSSPAETKRRWVRGRLVEVEEE
ncbi:unnamed protein product [Spirodela intermedia]|uniref:Nuclease associated modular domain-containing protein n=1 Tax=Spirodela intermedia TaxID=51605 RepID=A0A7I8IEN5_SPIIN|nr:unnamed protein product [Spirodela intermedia]CAA6656257.1 unnamed protein product [Spirodela intermedia]